MSEQWEQGRHPAQAEEHGPVYIDEAEFERIVDSMVMRRLATDAAYRNAADADQQAAREEQIEREVVADLQSRYRVR